MTASFQVTSNKVQGTSSHNFLALDTCNLKLEPTSGGVAC